MFYTTSGWFTNLVLTVAMEVPIPIVLLRAAQPRPAHVGGLAILANVATHPVDWFVISQLLLVGTGAYVVAAEQSWAVAAEADSAVAPAALR
jgi:hypothetical protein